MLKKIKKIISETDRFLYSKFGSNNSTKLLENIKEAHIIFSHLNEIGNDTKVRFVGGCVRNAISGENIDDIDLATSLEPNEVKKRLNKNNIKTIDTGILHGTITAICNKRKFEITTLRKDIKTDGRHADIKFTSDWKEDASRRDFTINAIYVDIEGRIYDPLGGVTDLQKGIVKFIGSPELRIQEDYLRILRYFRFFLHYSNIDHDEETITSIKKNINGMNKIANERILDELKKILANKNLYNLFSDKISNEIILNIFPQFKYNERLKILNSLDKKIRKIFDYNIILATLILDQTNNYEYFCHKYKTSNHIKKRLENISSNFENLENKNFYSKDSIKRLIYLTNKNYVKDLLSFSIFVNKKISYFDIIKLIDYVINCEIPKFPISGDYLKKYGYEPGETMGKKLKLLEKKWIENKFNIEQDIIEKFLEKKTKN
tara:strand:- start:783 stop:2081 length:1299 start_codon:yes stop_codon:yes gene_type:complete